MAGDQYGPSHEVEDHFDRRTCREVEELVRRGTPPVEPSLVPLAWYYLAKHEKRAMRRGVWWSVPFFVYALVEAVIYWGANNIGVAMLFTAMAAVGAAGIVWLPGAIGRSRQRLARSRETLATVSGQQL